MIKVTIKNREDVQTHGAQFESLAAAQPWIDDCIATNAWGKAAYTEIIPAKDAVLDENGVEIEPAVPEQTIEHPAEYTIEIVDITEEVEKERKLQDRIKKQEFGAKFMAEVLELVDAKVVSGDLSQADLAAMESDADLMLIEKVAWRGMIDTLRTLVSSYSGPYYTQQDKDFLVSLIDNSGLI